MLKQKYNYFEFALIRKKKRRINNENSNNLKIQDIKTILKQFFWVFLNILNLKKKKIFKLRMIKRDNRDAIDS